MQPPLFNVAYRGLIASPVQTEGLPASETYLGQALGRLLSDLPITFRRTLAGGPVLNHVGAAVPNYSTEIAPIFYKHCAVCHHPGGVAPFAMTNHSVITNWSQSIKHALLSNRMPPWHADPEYGYFTNNLSLPGDLRAALVRWIDSGAPRGTGPDPLAESPAPPAYDAWPADLGEPDALVTIPVQQIKATGTEPYRYIHVQTPSPTNVWLRAAIIRPSNYWSVHHYFVFLGRTTVYDAHIAEFVPGYKPLRYPVDSGVFLTQSNWLTFNLHYQTRGTPTNDQPVLALWYHKTRPAKTWAMAALWNDDFAIPPGASDHAVQSQWIAPNPITIHRLNPHMHLRGSG